MSWQVSIIVDELTVLVLVIVDELAVPIIVGEFAGGHCCQ